MLLIMSNIFLSITTVSKEIAQILQLLPIPLEALLDNSTPTLSAR